jgi:hypothetical protein
VGLHCLCMHLLGVTALCEDVTHGITSLVKQLVMVILESHSEKEVRSEMRSDASRSGTSHIQSSLTRLQPHLLDFFKWIRQLRNSLVKLCRIVEVVECVHPSLRYGRLHLSLHYLVTLQDLIFIYISHFTSLHFTKSLQDPLD